jgi:hypothetical protein
LRQCRRARVLVRAFWELARYDALSRARGFAGIRRHMGGVRHAASPAPRCHVEAAVHAVTCATSFYWKPLLCLQRSVVTARLLRAEGVDADVVIGYRARPFFSHAWVEVDGRVVNDSPAYQTKLQPLDRF